MWIDLTFNWLIELDIPSSLLFIRLFIYIPFQLDSMVLVGNEAMRTILNPKPFVCCESKSTHLLSEVTSSIPWVLMLVLCTIDNLQVLYVFIYYAFASSICIFNNLIITFRCNVVENLNKSFSYIHNRFLTNELLCMKRNEFKQVCEWKAIQDNYF